jgi:phosphoribosylglycinamide formyltransferase 2
VAPILLHGSSASAVVLADRQADRFGFEGVNQALALGTAETPVDLRLFGKPEALPGRRMGVALARAADVTHAIDLAKACAAAVSIAYEED